MSDNWLRLDEVATDLGVHYMTAYRYVRLGLIPATKVGHTWRITPEALAEFVRSREEGASSEGLQAPGVDWSTRYEARILAGDRHGAWSVIESCRVAGTATSDVYLAVIAPALRRVGEYWEAGEIDVFHEHRATAIVRQHIGRLSQYFSRPGRTRGTVVIGCAPGEHHDIGLTMIGDLIRQEGFSCFDLGSDVPILAFEMAAKEADSLVAVGVSFHSADRIDVTAEVVRHLRAAVPGVRIMAGGHGAQGTDADDKIGADHVHSDVASAVRWLSELAV